VHDRGRVLADLACAVADGARVISDFRVMADQRELFGVVASVPAAWRTLKEIALAGARADRRITAAMTAARRHAWAHVVARPGALPGVRLDAYIDAAHRVHAWVEDAIRYTPPDARPGERGVSLDGERRTGDALVWQTCGPQHVSGMLAGSRRAHRARARSPAEGGEPARRDEQGAVRGRANLHELRH
jgi:hypothetical protein